MKFAVRKIKTFWQEKLNSETVEKSFKYDHTCNVFKLAKFIF